MSEWLVLKGHFKCCNHTHFQTHRKRPRCDSKCKQIGPSANDNMLSDYLSEAKSLWKNACGKWQTKKDKTFLFVLHDFSGLYTWF